MVTLARRASRIPFAPVVAILFGIVAAILMAAVPQWLFERGVVASGLPGVIAAAAPPLGLLARLLAVAASFLVVTVILWAFLGPVAARLDDRVRQRTPWRDAGYDAPVPEDSDLFVAPRKPIFAPEELGAPLMSDEAITARVAADPPAAHVEPDPVVEPVITPVVADDEPPHEPLVSPRTDNSITALIRRLEEGLARRKAAGPDSPGGAALPASTPGPLSDAIGNDSGPISDDDANRFRQALGMFRRSARA
jgi:hypothetical protein